MAGYQTTELQGEEFWAAMLTTNAPAITAPARGITPAPTVVPTEGAALSLVPAATPAPAAAGPVYFGTTSLEISPVFAGMTASTAAMALLVLGCCCWGGRTKAR